MKFYTVFSLAILLSCLWIISSTIQTNCSIGHLPDEISIAKCGNRGYAMQCNQTHLEQIPKKYPKSNDETDFPPPLCLLNLSHNSIHRIEDRAFVNVVNLNSTDVLWLYLDFNNMSYIASNAFENLTNLLYLNLFGNHLTQPDSFGLGVFNPLLSLRNINFKENKFKTFEILGKELSSLKNLTGLYVDLCENCVFGADFKMLPNLVNLSLSGRSEKSCFAPHVTNETFRYVTRIRNLYVASCHINTIERGALSYLTNISLLDISYNEELNFTGMNEALYGLRNSSTLELLNVNRINTPYETGIKLELSHIENLKTLGALKTLHMDLNKIEVFDEKIFIPFQLPNTLRDFTLSGNRLTYGNYTKFVYKAIGITNLSLDISRQHLNFDPFFYEHYETSKLSNLDLCGNISKLPTNDNDCPDICSVCLPRGLKKIRWRQSFVNFKVERPMCICGADGLEHLDMSFNLILKWNEIVYGLENLTHLDLSENYCDEVKPAFFDNLTSLKYLNVSGNMLGQSFDPQLNPDASIMFKRQQNLTKLDMSFNKIVRLPTDIFKPLTKLEYLNLSGNIIEEWNFSLDSTRYLRDLDLSGNKLYGLPESLTSYLDTLLEEYFCNKNKSSCIYVDLSSNPLECACKTLPFLKWMRYSIVNVHFNLDDTCRLNSENYKFSSNDDLDKILNILENDKCQDRSWVIWAESVGFSVLTCIVSVIVCCLVYKNRWKLRYIYYSRNRRYRHEGFERLFENDAFVSYTKNNASFIKNQMVPALEVQHGFRLWVADRNSLPGTSIAENISHGIYSSRKSVLLINREYLNDGWCDYEMNMAHMESIETKRRLIIVVLMESIPMEELPICLMRFLHSERSLEYPEHEHDLSTFWINLADEINC